VRFQPKSAAEIKAESSNRTNTLWPRGTYDFEVVNATDEVSKAGNEMIKLQLRVFDASGSTQMVWDYLLSSIAEKLMHAAEAFGLTSQYDAGELDASDFEGKAGQVILYIQKGKDGYPDKNAVADYVRRQVPLTMPLFKTDAPKGKPVMAGAGSDLDDEIPF
jgi:hypothetical protein